MTKIDPALSKDLVIVNDALAKLPKKIATDKDYALVESANAIAVAFKKKVEAFFQKAETPLKDALKALKAEREALTDPADEVIAATKPLISSWALAKELEAEKERKRLQKIADDAAKADRKAEIEALKADGDKASARALASVPVVAQEVEVVSKAVVDGLSFRVDVEVEVLGINLVPDEYVNKTLRLADVKAAWKADAKIKIPGLRLSETRTQVRKG
jgi:hypothetical protein